MKFMIQSHATQQALGGLVVAMATGGDIRPFALVAVSAGAGYLGSLAPLRVRG